MFQPKWLIVAIIFAMMGALVLSSVTKKIKEFQNRIEPVKEEPLMKDVTNKTPMKITSGAFEDGGMIPAQFTCDGTDVNPPFVINNVPSEAKSLVLIMDDPDVPKDVREDGVWDHWIIFNIPPNTSAIAQESEPTGVRGMSTNGDTEFHGPCPPDGEHRYFFKLYALDQMLDLGEEASKRAVEQAMEGHVIEKTQLIGRYKR